MSLLYKYIEVLGLFPHVPPTVVPAEGDAVPVPTNGKTEEEYEFFHRKN